MFWLLLILCAGLPTIQSEAVDVWRDQEKAAPADRPYLRYLILYNLTDDDGRRGEARVVSRWWIHSLSMRRRMTRPKEIGKTLLRVDLRDYAWSADAWEKLAAADRYVDEYSVDTDVLEALRYYSGSAKPLLRLDFFAARSCLEPDYSRFLGLPATLKELFAVLGVQEEAVKKLSLNIAGAKLESIVTLHNRQVERYPTITGYFWKTRDVKSNVGDQAVLDNLFGVRADAGEYLFTLPNGLQGGYLTNGKGEQQAVAPAEIAVDSQTSFQDKQVFNYRNCIGCHEKGIRDVDDVVSALVKGRRLAIETYSKEDQRRIEELYLAPLVQTIGVDQGRYALAVYEACGRTPQEASRQFLRLIHEYQEPLVDAARAARELGVEVAALAAVLDRAARAYPAQSLSLLAIPAGAGLPVDQWEALFGFAAAAAKGAKQ